MEEETPATRAPSVPYPDFPEQDENGIDRSLLRANLRLTPTERLQKHQRALRLVLEMRRAGRDAGLRGEFLTE